MSLNRKILYYFTVFLIFTQISYAADSLEIISPSYFGEQKNVFDEIHYLENELLSFRFCTDTNAENIEAKLVCSTGDEKLKLFTDKKKSGCYFHNYNLQLVSCDDFTLQIDYSVDSKEKQIKREFMKEKQSTLINHVLGKNYQTLSVSDMSYYLIVQNEVESRTSDISEDIYERLRDSRDNDDKCWPSNNCDPFTTSLIINNLKIAGYALDTRLLEDGQQYLEKSLIDNDNNPLRFTIELDHDFDENEEITCDLVIDDDTDDEETYEFDENDNDIIDEFASESISFSCNATVEQIEFDLYNINDKIQISEDYDDSTSFSQTLSEFACSGEDDDCDYDTSLRNINTYGSNFENSGLIQNYLSSLISEDDDETKIDTSEEYEDTGKYLYTTKNTELVDFLKFKQNNDGSWGSGSKDDKILETSWAVLGLENSDGASEHLSDGKNWIYFNEPTSGWGSIEENTLAYLAIKEQIKPYLKISAVNELEETTYFTINNPTIHNIKNLEVIVNDNIKSYLSYTEDLGNLDGEASLDFNISYNAPFFGTLTGEIKIVGLDGKNSKLDLISFPVNLKGPSPFSISSEDLPISEESPYVEISVNSNVNTFSSSCSYTNPFTNDVISQTITNQNSTVKVENTNLKSGIYTIEFKCSSDGNDFVLQTDVNVSVAKKTFEIKQSSVNITSLFDFSIDVHSLDIDKQTLNFKVTGDFEGVIEPTEEDKIIASNDTREIFFTISSPVFLEALGDSGKGDILITSESGYVQKIPINIGGENLEDGGGSSLLSWVLIFFAILLIGFIILVIVRYFQLKKIHEEEGTQNDDEMYFEDDHVEFK